MMGSWVLIHPCCRRPRSVFWDLKYRKSCKATRHQRQNVKEEDQECLNVLNISLSPIPLFHLYYKTGWPAFITSLVHSWRSRVSNFTCIHYCSRWTNYTAALICLEVTCSTLTDCVWGWYKTHSIPAGKTGHVGGRGLLHSLAHKTCLWADEK